MLISFHFSATPHPPGAHDPMDRAVSMAARVENALGAAPYVSFDRSVLRLHVEGDGSRASAAIPALRSDATTMGFQLVAVVMSNPAGGDGVGVVFASAGAGPVMLDDL